MLLFTTLAILATTHGLRSPIIANRRCRLRTVSALRTETNVVDVVGEILPMTPDGSAPSSGSAANRLALIQSLQGGLVRVLEVVPKPIIYAVTAVVSGLLFFEMSRFVSVFSIPVLLVLGATQSIKEKLDDIKASPKTLDVSTLNEDDVVGYDTVVGTEAVVRQTISNHDTEETRTSSRRKLNEISRRIADARTAMTDATSAASSLKDRISSHQERLKDLNHDKQ